ncbi:MAG TPA: hypothetical protein VJB57_17240, partial [Dehalococcoidia bacterium]|nr:hypothetical protein [Dehalococcoidia bacterium]
GFVRGGDGAYNRLVPKRPRQAHIPAQARKRKIRRPFGLSSDQEASDAGPELEPNFADEPLNRMGVAGLGNSGPVDTSPRVGRRLELVNRSREQVAVRVIPGQLPTFERSYLINELRRIAVISTGLLALIIVLAVVLR